MQSTTVTYPSGPWPTGSQFRINLQSSPTDGNILAQSGTFNISYSALSVTPTTTTANVAVPTTLSIPAATTPSVVTITSAGASDAGIAAAGASGGIVPSVVGHLFCSLSRPADHLLQVAKSGAASLGQSTVLVGAMIAVAGAAGMLL